MTVLCQHYSINLVRISSAVSLSCFWCRWAAVFRDLSPWSPWIWNRSSVSLPFMTLTLLESPGQRLSLSLDLSDVSLSLNSSHTLLAGIRHTWCALFSVWGGILAWSHVCQASPLKSYYFSLCPQYKYVNILFFTIPFLTHFGIN